MKIVTWNVNSVKARLERLLAFLGREQPDVLCLQELKVTDENFPTDEITEVGYHASVFGQKTYNGVAILTRKEPVCVTKSFRDGVDDPQSRCVHVGLEQVDVVCLYVPNGQAVGSDKWEYKLEWYRRLGSYLESRWTPADDLVICGDFNVAPTDRDVARPEEWGDSVLCHADARQALDRVVSWGFEDLLRVHNPDVDGPLTWWDYRMLGFPKNNGLRIDHVFATMPMAARCTGVRVDRDERKGTKPSDHAPVIAEFAD